MTNFLEFAASIWVHFLNPKPMLTHCLLSQQQSQLPYSNVRFGTLQFTTSNNSIAAINHTHPGTHTECVYHAIYTACISLHTIVSFLWPGHNAQVTPQKAATDDGSGWLFLWPFVNWCPSVLCFNYAQLAPDNGAPSQSQSQSLSLAPK